MHPISSASIESLPNELLLPILEACAVPSLFSVCKRWHHLLASEVMPSLYKKIAQLHFPRENATTQRTLMLTKVYQLNPALTSTEKVYQVFKQVLTLAKSISSLEFKEKTEEKRGLTLANYASYLLNINRLFLWKKLPGGEASLSREEIKHLSLVEFKWKTEEKRGLTLANYASYLLNINHLFLWKKLPGGEASLSREEIKHLSLVEFKWKTEEKRGLTLANYASYLLNINHLLLWKKLPGGEEYLSREEIKHLPLEKKGELLSNWIEENCKNITILDLSKAGLTYLPPEICQLSKLQTLDLNQNQLTSLPIEIWQLSQLQWLILNQNQLTSLPVEIGQLSKLQWLELDQNQLTVLPAEIGQLSQLQRLELNQNQLTALPTEIGQLSQLRVLYLNQNQLTSLPAEIGRLSRLQVLNLNQNQLTARPTEIGQLSQLKRLELAENPLKDIAEKIRQRFQL
ncbi:leucine-rich repeat domain-containing protein [Neochlamydia sp. AcF95]|uniref:leucine-rich repeat domain-containing protein n=1 Tax=Neochlamydia sp. AcF95 TaxID=2795734 RepID=UPI001BC9DF23|nr:leucine-rich repeat domain-containing protein [Neochlamydia sp. AcF95]MBS4169811.1 Uncharacterized protein [Neochlamydia sp. AcF95]